MFSLCAILSLLLDSPLSFCFFYIFGSNIVTNLYSFVAPTSQNPHKLNTRAVVPNNFLYVLNRSRLIISFKLYFLVVELNNTICFHLLQNLLCKFWLKISITTRPVLLRFLQKFRPTEPQFAVYKLIRKRDCN